MIYYMHISNLIYIAIYISPNFTPPPRPTLTMTSCRTSIPAAWVLRTSSYRYRGRSKCGLLDKMYPVTRISLGQFPWKLLSKSVKTSPVTVYGGVCLSRQNIHKKSREIVFFGAAEATGLGFVLLLSTLVCCQSTELIWVYCFFS